MTKLTAMDTNTRDEEMWKLANRRARFQRGLATYFIMNAFFWVIWYVTAGRNGVNTDMPWPIWAMIGWGIGLVFQYMEAYGAGKKNLVDKEYQKLKKQQEEKA